MNELDRWVNLEGPPPDDVRALLDAAFDERTPEEEARAEQRIFAAVAEDRRRRARRRTVTRVLGGALLAACFAGTVAFAWHLAPVDLRFGRRGLPSASDLVSTHVGHLVGTASATAPPPSPPRRPAPPSR